MQINVLKKAVFLSLIVLICPGCAQELSNLQSVLSATNKVLTTGNTDVNMSIPRLSPRQSQALQDQIHSKVGDQNIILAREEARMR
jgi:hypothetical protein